MLAWWEAMSLIEQVFATVGIAATVLLIVQLILLLVGAAGESGAAGDSGGADADFGDADVPDTDFGDMDVPDTDVGDAGVDVSIDAAAGDISIDSPLGSMDIDVQPGDWYGDVPTGDFTGEGTVPDVSTGGLRLFTIQGLVAFFAVFGWSGLLMLKSALHPAASVALAVVFGVLAMALIAWLFKAMLKLQQDGTMDIRNALGKSGTVYLNIPAHRAQRGKVSIMVQDRLVEVDAVTDEDEAIRTGAEVTVVGVSNKTSLIVRSK